TGRRRAARRASAGSSEPPPRRWSSSQRYPPCSRAPGRVRRRTRTGLGGQSAGHAESGREREVRRTMCLAIPGQVIDFADEPNRLARVEVAGVRRTVNVGLLDDVAAGDWVLIHVGFALSRVDEQEALATRRLLEAMGAEYETELEELKASAIE